MKFTQKVIESKMPDFISETRRPKPVPEGVVTNGTANMGTFDAPFRYLNLRDCNRPLGKSFPKFLLGTRLKEWEAFEISFDEGFLVGAIYSLGLAMTTVIMFYDKRTKKVSSNQCFCPLKKGALEQTLISGHNHLQAGVMEIDIVNKFEDGICDIKATCKQTKSKFYTDIDIRLTSISMPSVGVMPLGKNRPLYSQKELFKPTGTIKIGDEVFTMGENALSIIDDHRGYYPYKMHYDWITGMGNTEVDGKWGFNLTRNQSIDQDNYNENFVWLKGEIQPLPPITIKHESEKVWVAKDEYGYVDIRFEIEDAFRIDVNAGLVVADYTAPFGTLYGYIKDNDGVKHCVDNMVGMGEDKTYHM